MFRTVTHTKVQNGPVTVNGYSNGLSKEENTSGRYIILTGERSDHLYLGFMCLYADRCKLVVSTLIKSGDNCLRCFKLSNQLTNTREDLDIHVIHIPKQILKGLDQVKEYFGEGDLTNNNTIAIVAGKGSVEGFPGNCDFPVLRVLNSISTHSKRRSYIEKRSMNDDMWEVNTRPMPTEYRNLFQLINDFIALSFNFK